MSMITATAWVPRGRAAQFPTKYEFNEEEFDRIEKLARLHLEDAQQDLDDAREEESNSKNIKTTVAAAKTNGETDDDLREYDLEHYDDSDQDQDEEQDEGMKDSEADGVPARDAMGMFGSVKNLVYHASNDDDPYITLKEDSDSEEEELQVLASDNMIVAARVEDEVAHLQVYVYEDEEDNLYVHHDMMLPAIPLAVEYIHCPAGLPGSTSAPTAQPTRQQGNLIAVGTMDPEIELWDLDTVDSMYPYAILGGSPSTSASSAAAPPQPSGKKKKRKGQKIQQTHHTDAVLALASNPQHPNLLASASADTTIKLWDLNTASADGTQAASSYALHADKVCSLSWHPSEATALLSGSYDKSVIAADMRAPDASASAGAATSSDGNGSSSNNRRKWTVESDVESVRWNPHNESTFFVSTEAGMLHHFDARVTPSASASSASPVSKALWSLAAHDAPLSAFDINAHINGYIATGSSDKTVKLWRLPGTADAGQGEAAGPTLITTKRPEVGRVFSVGFAPDEAVAYRLAVAGSKGALQVWDTSTNAAVRRAFGAAATTAADGADSAREKMVSLALDDDDDDDDDGEK